MEQSVKAYAYILVRIFLGCVFIYASYDKILSPQDFARAVYNYHLFPVELINLIAIILPWLEMIIGICLITGVYPGGAALLAFLLNIVFIFALSSALVRGLDISCGCFSLNQESSKIGFFRIIEDFFFLIASVYVLFIHLNRRQINPKPLHVPDKP